MAATDGRIKKLNNTPARKAKQSKLRSLQKKVRAESDSLRRSLYEEQAEELMAECRDESANSKLGDLRLIREGMKEFREILDSRNENSKLPKSDLEYVL